MNNRLCLILCAIVSSLTALSCGQQKGGAENEPAYNRRPTATEVFELRSKCAALGEKIIAGNIIGSALTQDELSRYNPETNRCYVRLEVSTADLTTPQERFIRREYLYDGQTREMLATAPWEGNRKSAMIFSDSLKKYVRDPVLPTYEETDALIEKFVAEDREP